MTSRVLIVGASRGSGLGPPSQAGFDAVMHTHVLGALRVLPMLAEALEALRPADNGGFFNFDGQPLAW